MQAIFTDISHDDIHVISQSLKPPLDQYITLLWASKGIPSFKKERILPDGSASLLFNFSGTITARSSDQLIILPQCFISGITSSWFDLTYSGMHEQVGIIFKPYGAFSLLDIPMIELHNTAVDLQLIINHTFQEIYERMQEAGSLEQRLQMLNDFLTKKLISKILDPSIPRLTNILQANEDITVRQLADKAGFSQQHVSRIFRRHIGVSPKMIQRIFRFQQAIRLIKQTKNSLTDTGYEANYYDQSHFINEFKSMAGIPPRGLYDHHSPTIDRIAIV
jgi:AraC-like DNA-binding protein